MNQIPFIPESAPFSAEQRAWLNGFLAGLYAHGTGATAPALPPGAPAKPAEPLLILFGSQTGTAEGLAKRLAGESKQRGFAPSVLPLDDFEKANLAAAQKAIIISSTWGDGDPPDNAVNFWSWLNAGTAPRLENLHYAVLGLGDKNYAEFCSASKKFDARLEALGARRLLERGECDVDYEAAAKAWSENLWQKLSVSGAAESVSAPAPVNESIDAASHDSGWSNKPNLFPRVCSPASCCNCLWLRAKEVYHHEISLEGSGLAYEPGDALGVMPQNCPALVNSLLTALHCTGEEPVKIGEGAMPLRRSFCPSLRNHQTCRRSNRFCRQSRTRLRIGRPACAGARGRFEKMALGPRFARCPFSPSCADELWRVIAHVAKTCAAPLQHFLQSQGASRPGPSHGRRSSAMTLHGRDSCKGVASTFLADHAGADNTMGVFVQTSHGFKLPVSGDTPIIMVGPGTGIAPFRSFLEERQALGAKGGNWLFFGDQKYATDFLYEEELTAWQKSGHLTRLDLAFSRDQAEKIYVQDRMVEHAQQLWSWLQDGAHFYVCGDASRMAKDVDAALHKVFETAGGLGAG